MCCKISFLASVGMLSSCTEYNATQSDFSKTTANRFPSEGDRAISRIWLWFMCPVGPSTGALTEYTFSCFNSNTIVVSSTVPTSIFPCMYTYLQLMLSLSNKSNGYRFCHASKWINSCYRVPSKQTINDEKKWVRKGDMQKCGVLNFLPERQDLEDWSYPYTPSVAYPTFSIWLAWKEISINFWIHP